jgi:hypothetical protein
MIAGVSRLAGAILLEAEREAYLIGNTKEPCDWAAAGFETPSDVDALRRPWIRLQGAGVPKHATLLLTSVHHDGPAIADLLARRFLIRRNGSVSERLWRIAIGQDEDAEPVNVSDASWLLSMPDRVWEIVRDAALKCL